MTMIDLTNNNLCRVLDVLVKGVLYLTEKGKNKPALDVA
jgi:hypothetical protein